MRNIINGKDFQKMLASGLANLISAEKVVNSMNVFPVADGDTGTNMRLTLEHGYKISKPNKHLGTYLKDVASGMLLGARGNSGVILSQLFKGMSNELLNKGIVNPGELKSGLINAYVVAYRSVINPVEGTILTVAREGIENVKGKIRGKISIESTVKLYLDAMNESLKHTPELLPTLKEAAVLDSGAFGYIKIVEGMYKYLIGEEISGEVQVPEIETSTGTVRFFDENSDFDDGYCMEFLLQLLNSRNYQEKFDLNNYIAMIKPFGNSIVALQDGSIVKVHIHTINPSNIIDISRNYGEFISFKLENMQLQHNEFSVIKDKKQKENAKELGIIAVTNGDAIAKAYRELGVDAVLDGGSSMNTSTDEFVHAIESVNAKKIVIFPNNVNTVLAAKQAISVLKMEDEVEVIESSTMMEGYYALQMDVPDAPSEDRIPEFKNNISLVTTVGVSIASKDYEGEGFACKKGDFIATLNDKLVAKGKDAVEAFKNALNAYPEIGEKYSMIVYLGKEGVSLEQDVNELLDNEFSDIEHLVSNGEQDIYLILAGLM